LLTNYHFFYSFLLLHHPHTFLFSLVTFSYSLSSILGIKWIEEEELKLSDYVYSRLSADPRICLLGKNGGWKGHHLPIFAFMIRRGRRFLHYNLVALLLNDLFGIQCRGKDDHFICMVFLLFISLSLSYCLFLCISTLTNSTPSLLHDIYH
jgi:hypothetical protein